MPATVLFLLVLLAWAVYLAQHWIRRREHLATMEAVDRFSVAMRVLRRRDVALADAPSGPARPVVARPVVARSVAARRRVAHGGGMTVRLSHGVSAGSAPAPAAAPTAAPAPAPVAAVSPVPAPARPVARKGRRGPTPLQRGLAWLLLAAIVAVPVTAVLAWRHILLWVSVGLALAVAVASLGALVFLARRRRASYAAARRTGARPVAAPTPAPAAVDTESPSPVEAPAPVAVVTAEPGTWTPTRVPTPTYLLKDTAAPAYRPRSAVAEEPAMATSTPRPAARAVGD